MKTEESEQNAISSWAPKGRLRCQNPTIRLAHYMTWRIMVNYYLGITPSKKFKSGPTLNKNNRFKS